MPEMSVIVVNWNGKHFLDTCLGALRQQTFRDFETILVDNGSQDGSAEYARMHFPEVHLLELSENRGFTGGNIAGYEQAHGELIILLNNDAEAHPQWLKEIHKASVEYPEAGSFACKMLYFDERNRIDNRGFGLTTAGLSTDLGRDEHDGPAWGECRRVFGACGGAAVYRRKILEEIGFFDLDFFMTYEDVDLSFRAQLRGYECVFVSGAIVYHRYRGTMKKYPARQVYFSQRNIEFVFVKNMPFGLMLRCLPQRAIYEVGGLIYFTMQGNGGSFLQAKVDALWQLPALLRKRRQIQKKRTLSGTELRALMDRRWFRPRWKKFLRVWRKPARVCMERSQVAD